MRLHPIPKLLNFGYRGTCFSQFWRCCRSDSQALLSMPPASLYDTRSNLNNILAENIASIAATKMPRRLNSTMNRHKAAPLTLYCADCLALTCKLLCWNRSLTTLYQGNRIGFYEKFLLTSSMRECGGKTRNPIFNAKLLHNVFRRTALEK